MYKLYEVEVNYVLLISQYALCNVEVLYLCNVLSHGKVSKCMPTLGYHLNFLCTLWFISEHILQCISVLVPLSLYTFISRVLI